MYILVYILPFPKNKIHILREVLTTGSILKINEIYEDVDEQLEPENKDRNTFEYLGQPVKLFQELKLNPVDEKGFVKKRIIEEGGGLPLSDENTASIAYTSYWENETEPFDLVKISKPLVSFLSYFLLYICKF